MDNNGQGQVPPVQPPSGQGGGNPPPQPQRYELWEENGQRVSATADEIKQWKSGHMMQTDYTKKTQDLARERANYEARVMEKATQLYMEALEAEKDKGGNAPPPANGQPDPSAAARQETEKLRREWQEYRTRQESEKYQGKLQSFQAEFSKKYPNMNWNDVLIRYYQQGSDDADPAAEFERFAKESHEGRDAERQKIIDEYVKSKSTPSPRGEFGAGGTPLGGDGKLPLPKSFAEARARAEGRFAVKQ